MTAAMCLAFVAGIFLTVRGFGQDAQRQELERKIAELRRQREQLAEQQRHAMKAQLGDRLKLLMDFSPEELRFALVLKAHEKYEGASLISAEDDPVFLGKITDSLEIDSIFNTIGQYGSTIGARSIWNTIGTYGSTISNSSAFNTIAMRPPLIVKDNKIIGRLTVNRIIPGGMDPRFLKMCFEQ
jgi:hypothetical protein